MMSLVIHFISLSCIYKPFNCFSSPRVDKTQLWWSKSRIGSVARLEVGFGIFLSLVLRFKFSHTPHFFIHFTFTFIFDWVHKTTSCHSIILELWFVWKLILQFQRELFRNVPLVWDFSLFTCFQNLIHFVVFSVVDLVINRLIIAFGYSLTCIILLV